MPPRLCSCCCCLDAVRKDVEMSSTAERSRGRIVRLVVVGSMERKMEVVRPPSGPRRLRQSAASSVSSHVAAVDGARVIFNEVPPRDLDAPRMSSDFDEYLLHADAAIVVADSSRPDCWPLADRWRARLAACKKLPMVLLVTGDQTKQSLAPELRKFSENSPLQIVDSFVGTADAAVQRIVAHARKTSSSRSRRPDSSFV